MNYRKCTEAEIKKEVEVKIVDIANKLDLSLVDNKKFKNIVSEAASDITPRLIEENIFYDYTLNKELDLVYCFSQKEEIVNNKLLLGPMSEKDFEYLNNAIYRYFVKWILSKTLVS